MLIFKHLHQACFSQSLSRRLAFYSHLTNRAMSFDISSRNVEFGVLCPGTLMQNLQRDDPENVRKIKSLQTAYSTRHVTWQCPVGCSDLNVVKDFIKSIDSLEKLSVVNYERDTAALWEGIYHHADSLSDLAIHGPPQKQLDVWTTSVINQVATRLTHLKKLELDISLEEAENRLSALVETAHEEAPSALGEVSKLSQLESILINVNLRDSASSFSNEHTWDVMGCISFPLPNKEPCKALAQHIFNMFQTHSPDNSLKHLELRFPRRCWDDRMQFWTLAYSVHVKKDEAGVTVDAEEDWKEYLPGEQDLANGRIHPVLRKLVDEANAERLGY